MSTDMALLEGEPPRAVITPDEGGRGFLTMRPYQIEAVDAAYEAWLDYDAILLVLATGLGKTCCASEVIHRWPASAGRVLWLAHMRELIFQARDMIGLHTEEEPAIEMGMLRENADGHPVLDHTKTLVASVQTMVRRLDRFNPRDFGLIVIDEFHHIGAVTHRKIWDYFKQGNPAIKCLGLTATPYRGDKISLGCVAETCPFEMGIREGIDDGWLVPIQQRYIVVDGLDFSSCRTVAKDLNEGDLEEVMLGGHATEGMSDAERQELQERQERMLHAVAVPTIKESQGRPTLLFCVTVNHAERMTEVLNRYPGVNAELLVGTTPEDERQDRVKRFRAGLIQILVVVGIATEGFDAPAVEVVAMARPTKQQGFYVQCIGRATRPLPGLVDRYNTPEERQQAIANSRKAHCTILDFVGVSGKHKLVSTADVLAGDMPPELVEAVVDEMRESGEAEDVREAVWRKQKEIEEQKRKEAEERARKWAERERRKREREEEERKQQEEEERERRERVESAKRAEEERRARVRAEVEYRAREIDPFGQDRVPERAQPQFRGGSTDAQIKMLRSLGVDESTSMNWSRKQASTVIGKLVAQTGGQWIMRFGKYRGKRLNEMPHAYLRWAAENIQSPDFQRNLEKFRDEYRADLEYQRQKDRQAAEAKA